MALSEDTIVIVAAQLTAAHCARAAPYGYDPADENAETPQHVVDRLFRTYADRLRRGQLNHPAPPY